MESISCGGDRKPQIFYTETSMTFLTCNRVMYKGTAVLQAIVLSSNGCVLLREKVILTSIIHRIQLWLYSTMTYTNYAVIAI